MPEMDGYTATAHIREHLGEKSNIPIIIITCRGGLNEKAKSMLIGANTYVPKPINARELLDEITTLVVNKPLYL
jgi:DNA-binding response OmpR family regulator